MVGANQDEELLAYEVSGLNDPELSAHYNIGRFNH